MGASLARKKFISSFLLGVIDSRKIQFNEIALHIESDAKTESVERTIQSFFKDYEKDRINLLSKLLNVIGKARIDLIVGDREFIGIG